MAFAGVTVQMPGSDEVVALKNPLGPVTISEFGRMMNVLSKDVRWPNRAYYDGIRSSYRTEGEKRPCKAYYLELK